MFITCSITVACCCIHFCLFYFFFNFLLCLYCCFFFFFFSSRRRHTRLQGDWSSDVCSSDLIGPLGGHRRRGEGQDRKELRRRPVGRCESQEPGHHQGRVRPRRVSLPRARDRKSTRLNSSHLVISYAVFCLKKKKIRHLVS